MLDVFICDDDLIVTNDVKEYIEGIMADSCSVMSYNSIKELYGSIMISQHVPDVLIMDINLGNGIEAAKEIQCLYPRVKLIFITESIDYATEIFETNPTYFLLKPLDMKKLHAAVEKACTLVNEERMDSIIVKSKGAEVAVRRREIVYVESSGRKLILHLNVNSDSSHSKLFDSSIEVYEQMDAMQLKLGHDFVRSHQSFLINMKYIVERNRNFFSLFNGEHLPISKANLKEAKDKFESYMGI